MPGERTLPAEIDALRADGSDPARADLLTILRGTDDPVTRNAAALALSDLGERKMIPVTAKLLRDDRTRGSRGTLLYALRPFDTRTLAHTLIDIATSDTFEASREAFALLDGMTGPLCDEDHDACEHLARSRLAAATDPEQQTWLQVVVGLFEPADAAATT